MSLLTWNHACSVDVRSMDDQHGILMDTANELRLALMRGSGQEQIGEILNRLIEFTSMHFESEEKLMEDSCFPALAEHRAEHRRMLAQMQQSAHCLHQAETLSPKAILLTLRDSFLGHIENLDSFYGPWLNERGIF